MEEKINSHDKSVRLTLRSLVLWSIAPLKRLKYINTIIDMHKSAIQNGASAPWSVLQVLSRCVIHGDPTVKRLAHFLLWKSVRPQVQMVAR